MPQLPSGRRILYESGGHGTVDGGDINAMVQYIMASICPVPTVILDADYVASNADQVIIYSSLNSPHTVTLTPCGGPINLKVWQIKDKSGNCSLTKSIILASTSGTFDGLASTAISQAWGSKTFYDDGVNFFMAGSFLPSVGSSSLQKSDGNGGLMNAVAGTDYASPSSLSGYVPTTTTVNGHALSTNVTVSASDLGLSTVATSGSYNDLSNKPGLATVATSGSYTDLSNQPTIPSTLRTTSTLSLSLVGSGATGTQISTLKDSTVRANVSTSTTSTIGGPSTSVITLKKCSTNNATEGSWTTVATLENDQTITLAVVLQSTQVVKGQLETDVPAGWYVKLVNSGTGTHTEGFISGEQTVYG